MTVHHIDVYLNENEWQWRISMLSDKGAMAGEDIIAESSGVGYSTEKECLHDMFGIFFGGYDDSFLGRYARWQELGASVNDLEEAPMAQVTHHPEADGPNYEADTPGFVCGTTSIAELLQEHTPSGAEGEGLVSCWCSTERFDSFAQHAAHVAEVLVTALHE